MVEHTGKLKAASIVFAAASILHRSILWYSRHARNKLLHHIITVFFTEAFVMLLSTTYTVVFSHVSFFVDLL